MKNPALFSLKDNSYKLKCRLLHFLFGTLRVKDIVLMAKPAYMFVQFEQDTLHSLNKN